MSTPPSVISARANTARSTRRPSRRSRRSGWAVGCRCRPATGDRGEGGARVGGERPHADRQPDDRDRRPDPAPGDAGVDDQRGDRGAGQRARVEQRVEAHQCRGVVAEPVGRLGVHGGVDGAPGDLHEDEHGGEGPAVVHEREHAQEDRPGEQRDPQQPARPDAVRQVRHDRARCAGHRDGDGQQHAQLGVVEREGVLDVEEHHGPAAPEEAEGGERRDDRALPRRGAAPPRRAGSRLRAVPAAPRLGQERRRGRPRPG